MSYKIYALEESHITIVGGQLSGGNQGNGKHLVGKEITLDTSDWMPISISDNDDHFADSDGSQRLSDPLDFNGRSYSGNQKVEAEYTLQVTDGTDTYTVIGFNINEPGAKNAYGTVEGLAFIDKFPPVGTPLKVVSASEGPGKSAQHHETYAQPPCFTAGTLIETPEGHVPVETLREGDAVLTRDAGVQIIRWAGAAHIDSARLAGNARFRPVLIRAGAFAPGLPARDMQVSRQHRVLMEDWRADLLFGSTEVLAAAVHLVNDDTVQHVYDLSPVTYYHFMFDAHQIVRADGIWAESLRPGPAVVSTLGRAAQEELFEIFPELREAEEAPFPAARPLLRDWETAVLLQS
ncbi:MAG: Hint domain-containing protein [Pseudomonadota bacterium]